MGGKRSKRQDGEREREESVNSLKPKILHINQSQKPLETRPNGVFQQKRKKHKVLTNCINFIPAENTFFGGGQ